MRVGGLVGVAAMVAACSSGSGGGTDTGGGGGGGASNGPEVICVIPRADGGTEGCGVLKDLTPAGVTDATNNCKGTVESACPTAGLVGCCNVPSQGPGSVPSETCFYSGTASSLQSSCASILNGTWSTSQ